MFSNNPKNYLFLLLVLDFYRNIFYKKIFSIKISKNIFPCPMKTVFEFKKFINFKNKFTIFLLRIIEINHFF